jgi:hypothetical protein
VIIRVRRQAGQQEEVGVGRRHDDIIGDDVLDDLRRLSHLHDRAFEDPPGISVDRE